MFHTTISKCFKGNSEVFQSFRLFFFASPSVDKVVTVRESLKIWVDFLIACVQHGLRRLMLNRVVQCVALGKWMRPPKCFSICSIRFRNVYFISVGSRI